MAANPAEDRVTRIWATGSGPRAWAGLFPAEASFTARRDFELFSLSLSLFKIWSWKYFFYSQTNVPHVVRSIDSRPANERSLLIQEKLQQQRQREPTVWSASPCLNVTECHGLSNN